MAKGNVEILKQGLIKSEWDLIALDIVDWSRSYGFWRDPAEQMQAVSSWFMGKATYTVLRYDMRAAPHRSDWPGWRHEGFHSLLGQLFWNTFHTFYKGELHFSDEPDFYGKIVGPQEIHFWGDVQHVSAHALALTQKKMAAHDLWITVLDDRRLVIIEPFVSLREIWSHLLGFGR